MQTARRIESCADLAHASYRTEASGGLGTVAVSLWVVPPHKWFVFPTGALGRAVPVPRVRSPRGKRRPITVETLSHSPRVFHLHNFISESESDALVASALANDDPVLGLQRSTTGAEHQVSFNKVRRRTGRGAFKSAVTSAAPLTP